MSLPPARLMLKPAQLRLIQQIAETGQLQLAAERVGMTQPAASRMLAEIENQVGAQLFLRQPKGMEPTEIGRAVLRRARVILREMFSMASEVQALREGFGGALRVGAVTGPAVSYLVSAIREIKQGAPDADITVDVMPSRELLLHLAAGEMDFVLARILPEFDSQDFNILPMRDEKVAFLVRSSHPLGRAAPVTLTELAGQEWIMQQRGAPIREAALAAFADVGLSEPKNIVNSPSLLLTIAYLAQSDAVAPMSEEVAELLIRPPVGAGFAMLQVPHEIRVSPYYLLDLKRRPLSPLALRLREKLVALSKSPVRDAFG
ncbi:LysR family transcriptional regulator (plasmid) [Paracoccus versutus]|uniref:DNA-binding transcriptional LysR family regulator n=1 Tax=Paracoccus versutus TaxID=34007 RepID=A0A099FAL6_PARVE|nr:MULTISPECIES: LysR family transcriptional regulator [Paracoccus]WGR63480.1 LysR family transcriptional regulator [Paracoccus ferrooxidans]SFY42031.1 DNA-binding transcriptional regulator, LysR family [Paracoccus pantotrophus]KGJ07298.1 LysR family transcriptional regulator [Paracoccus versutus]MBT0782046.1 LysR family transcriptional regulator [Paracoccus sp. pheM1]MCJ1902048.1 LysR family transcriptional regulator [Paracoccus versutus]